MDFFVDRAHTWYSPMWNVSSGLFRWVVEFIAEHVDDAGLAAELREFASSGCSPFALGNYTEPQAEEIVRVIRGPLRDALADEHEDVRIRVQELVEMAKGWAEATDVFPLCLPWVFRHRPTGDPTTLHYRAEREPDDYIEVIFMGVRKSALGPELTYVAIDVTNNRYTLSTVHTDVNTVQADGLRVVDKRLNRKLDHTRA